MHPHSRDADRDAKRAADRHRHSSLFRALAVAAALLLAAANLPAAQAEDVSFNRDIRPILSESCFRCHGPDEATREADLRLDVRDAAIAGRDGMAAIVPGQPAASLLIERVTSDDELLRMPPPDAGPQLTDAQVERLRQWIAAGAEYQGHWAFEPVKRPPPPAVARAEWSRNPIDRFILSRLEGQGLEPSPEADRYTLARRVYLDLLGLPPTVDQVETFVRDEQPGAYERLVDRVLASPRFGERWGRHWLDQARYADSHGYTNDNERVMWPYRDWVIAAFNRDLPFDLFTSEQLAGDLMESGDPSLAQSRLVATGFHRNTLINSEGGTKADQFRDEQVKDRVDTTGGVWLGLTIGCAKCHTHKYDPISQREYYEFYGFFNSTADNNSIAPTIKAATPLQQARLDDLSERREQLERRLQDDPERAARQRAWEQELVASLNSAADNESGGEDGFWTVLELSGKSSQGAVLESLDDRSVLATGANQAADEYQLTANSPLTRIRSVRLEALRHPSLPQGGPGRAGNGNFVLSEIWFRTGDGRELRFLKSFADHSQPDYEITHAIDNRTDTGWAINGSPEGGANHERVAQFVLPEPLEVEQDHALTFTLQFNNGTAAYNLGRLRLSISGDEYVDMPSQGELAKLAVIPAAERSDSQLARLEDGFLRADPQLAPLYAELQQVVKEIEATKAAIPTTMVLRELDKPRPNHLQVRGDFLRLGEPLDSDVPAVLPPLFAEPDAAPQADAAPSTENAAADARRTRLDLARWLVRDDHPLTPRVRVNRLWMRMFGTGLVQTENDFGMQGSLPTHPELLDWLAAEFVRREWSTKQLLRLIATSATYRQSSQGADTSAAARVDPRNELLWRQNRIRVEGEVVRDLGLAASGLLSNKLGGPSVYPPQPDGVYAFTQRAKNWQTSAGEDRYRRGMYTFFYRSAPYPMLTTFDAPRFNQTCTRRDRSNTPLQSLTVANDEAMFEMMRALAARAWREVPADAADQERLVHLFRICFARPPTDGEQQVLAAFLVRQREALSERPEDAARIAGDDVPRYVAESVTEPPVEAAAWVATARVLFNLDEFITRE